MRTMIMLVCACLCLAHGRAAAADKGPDAAPRTGQYTATFTEYSPLSKPRDVYDRLGREPEKRTRGRDYKIKDRSFKVYVPDDYEPWKSYGLIVWTSSSDSGAPMKGYLKSLDKHHFIWVGADGAGFSHDNVLWASLALDGFHNVTERYRIDPERVYCGGTAGGGNLSSMLAISYADVFQGGLHLDGGASWEEFQPPNRKGPMNPHFSPRRKYLSLAKRKGRYVFATGKGAFGYARQKGVFPIYKEHFGERARLIEKPGIKNEFELFHDMELFEQLLVWLDKPLAEGADKFTRAGSRHEQRGDYPKAFEQYFLGMTHGDDAAAKKLEQLQADLDNGLAAAQKLIAQQEYYEGYVKLRTLRAYGKQLAPEVFDAIAEVEADKAAMAEIQATRRLRQAWGYYKQKKFATAKKYLRQIVEKYPDTAAAEKARNALQKAEQE
mgnify:CR=1 FL=1